jgi:hypothetical protein
VSDPGRAAQNGQALRTASQGTGQRKNESQDPSKETSFQESTCQSAEEEKIIFQNAPEKDE